ncbi:MAG TPA: hypothetical protein VFZ18_12155 [Longimicrobiaceae bacterium]
MRYVPRWILVVSAAGLAIAAAPAPAAAKCLESIGHPVLPGYVLVVDGKVVGEYAMNARADLPPAEKVAALSVACIDSPRDGAPGARQVATIVITHDGLPRALRAALAELVEAQESFRTRHGSYAPDLNVLGVSAARSVPIDMRVGSNGWSAVARIGALEPVCQVAVGAAAAEVRQRPGVVRCGTVR